MFFFSRNDKLSVDRDRAQRFSKKYFHISFFFVQITENNSKFLTLLNLFSFSKDAREKKLWKFFSLVARCFVQGMQRYKNFSHFKILSPLVEFYFQILGGSRRKVYIPNHPRINPPPLSPPSPFSPILKSSLTTFRFLFQIFHLLSPIKTHSINLNPRPSPTSLFLRIFRPIRQ